MTSPEILYVSVVPSALDTAAECARAGKMPEWGSVLANAQSSGRGQMRRSWSSPPGNIYAALRLPLAAPFNGAAASVALGGLFCMAFRDLGIDVALKWPNDLVIRLGNGSWAKTGGILLEERQGLLLGGIGINLTSAPTLLRPGAALPAACLQTIHAAIPSPAMLWEQLVKKIYILYKNAAFFDNEWRNMAWPLFIWKDQMVCIEDGAASFCGIFRGIGNLGGALLEENEPGIATPEITSGSMRLV